MPRPRFCSLEEMPPTHQLAYWFVRNILKREFQFRMDARVLKEAKDFVNPDRDPVTGKIPPPYTVDEVQGACLAYVDGKLTGRQERMQSLRQLFWGTPAYIEQYCAPPPRPPVFDQAKYNTWVLRHGARAIAREEWDGVYQLWDGIVCVPGKDSLTIGELVVKLGVTAARRSVLAYLRKLSHLPSPTRKPIARVPEV